MTPEQREVVNMALKEFGATLTEDNLIQKGNRVIPSVQVIVKGCRLRFESRATGDLVASVTISKSSVKKFVKKFWHWKEI